MKRKYLILINSITYEKELTTEEADYTDSELSDEEILEELHESCMEHEQAFNNTMILTEEEVAILKKII